LADAEVTVVDETEGVGTANVDTKSLVGVGGKTVHRQIVSIGDPDTFGQEATVNATGELLVKHTDAIPVTDNASSLTVDGNVGILAGTNNIGDVDVLSIAAGSNRIGKATIRNAADSADIDPLAESTFTTRINTQGQKAMSASTPVVLASDQSSIPVSLSEPISVDDNAGSLTVDNGGTFAVQDSEKVTDNAGFTDGTTKVQPSGFIFDETAGTALTENDAAAARIDSKRAQISVIEDETTRGRRVTVTASNALKVDASSVAVPVTDNAGSLTVDNAALSTTGGGVESGALRVTIANDSTGLLSVDDNGGALTVDQATAANLNCQAVGSIAHDSADSGNPVKVGGNARQTNPTAVADNDRVNAIFDDIGRQVVIMDQVRDLVNDQTTTISTTTETTVFTQVASVFNDLVMLTVANTSATATRIDFRDTTGGSVRFSLYCPAGATIGFVPKVPLKQATVNTNWTAQLGTAVTDVRIFVQVVRNV
jgi:hypothetical protein